jgi:hypothetical protein
MPTTDRWYVLHEDGSISRPTQSLALAREHAEDAAASSPGEPIRVLELVATCCSEPRTLWDEERPEPEPPRGLGRVMNRAAPESPPEDVEEHVEPRPPSREYRLGVDSMHVFDKTTGRTLCHAESLTTPATSEEVLQTADCPECGKLMKAAEDDSFRRRVAQERPRRGIQ